MIEVLERSQGDVLGVRASGRLTRADYREVWIPALERVIAERGHVRALLWMDAGFDGWETAAAWDDTVFGISHRKGFAALALVGGPSWVRWAAKLFALFLRGKVRCFPLDDLDRAWEWVATTTSPGAAKPKATGEQDVGGV